MAAAAQMEELTSGASGRIIPVFKNLRRTLPTNDSLRRSLIFIQSIILWFLLILSRNRHPHPHAVPSTASKRRREEEDTLRRRALAESLSMVDETGDGTSRCRWSTSLFFGVKGNALFVRSWFPVTGEMKYVREIC